MWEQEQAVWEQEQVAWEQEQAVEQIAMVLAVELDARVEELEDFFSHHLLMCRCVKMQRKEPV